MEWYLKALRNYAGFQGRARRKEYWLFWLFYGLGSLLLTAPFWVTDLARPFTGTEPTGVLARGTPEIVLGILALLWFLMHVLPGIAVTVRRLHDTGRSGLWYLLGIFLPFIGHIWLFVLMVLDSDPDENKYGANPKEVVA